MDADTAVAVSREGEIEAAHGFEHRPESLLYDELERLDLPAADA